MIKYEGLRQPDIFFYIWLKILLLSCRRNDKKDCITQYKQVFSF